jgi:1,4-alpha-glucan branching enzyme
MVSQEITMTGCPRTVKTYLPTEFQLYLFHEGTLFESYELFGAHVLKEGDKTYTRFCVWAPHAKWVRLVGSLNNWHGNGYDLHKINDEGVWVLVLEGNFESCIYKYEITTKTGKRILKTDPYGFFSELRPQTASVVYNLDGYQWQDHGWKKKRLRKNASLDPTVIYEVHAGSWKKKQDGSFLTYRELADELIPYVLEGGFTHIELLPLVEHPLDASWGYQGVGYYSLTSRYGSPHDFMYFVDQCHLNGIGVILDWVPGHFCKDEHGLYCFDGDYTYEYRVENDRENHIWGTANFDLGKKEVQSFLISNALFWIKYYHIDGFRVDAVSNIIFWPNSNGEHVNTFGLDFLKNLNEIVHQTDPSVMMIAEDSTDWPKVTAPVEHGGLGFSYKWNMGWMNDMLDYIETSPQHRKTKHNKVTFSFLYAYSEQFILPFSHDEVVHGKKSLLNKMPGDYWRKFAQLRLLLGYMMAHPGKKLWFMGTEFGQFAEWKDKEELDWNLFDYDMHQKFDEYTKQLIKIYKRSKPFYELDHTSDGFEWIDVNNTEQSIFSFIRKGTRSDDFLIVICNFRENPYEHYKIGVPKDGSYREILNSDAEVFGGANYQNKKILKTKNEPYHGKPVSLEMTIPPFGITVLRPVKQRKDLVENGKEKVRRHAVGRRKRK